jgi:hypothetical protein
MTYKFPFFEETITDPTIQVVYIHNDLRLKECHVDVILSTQVQDYGVSLDGFTYESTWTTDEVMAWAFVELTKYES